MPDLLELLFGDEVAWHLKRIAKAEKRIRRLKRMLPASAGPTEWDAIKDAIKSSEADIQWDESQLKRLLGKGKPAPAPAGKIPIKKGNTVCGYAEISIAARDNPDGIAEGAIVFDFQPVEGQDGCCKSYGWIQHVKRPGADTWRYDNAAWKEGVLGAGVGAESDPENPTQPTEKDRPASGHWKENPWYGAPTDPNVDPDEFARDPKPQQKIGDHPGKRGDKFRTQLVCVDTGEVLLTWEWTAENPGHGKPVPPPR
jgi:hypothetical protein